MREAFKYLTSILFLAIVVQVGFAGYGAFNAIDKADKGRTVTKKTIENGFDPHGVIGTLIVGIFRNGLQLMGVAAIYQFLITGVLVIIAVAVDQLSRRRRA